MIFHKQHVGKTSPLCTVRRQNKHYPLYTKLVKKEPKQNSDLKQRVLSQRKEQKQRKMLRLIKKNKSNRVMQNRQKERDHRQSYRLTCWLYVKLEISTHWR